MLHEFHFLRPLWLLALIPLAALLWRLARGNPGGEIWRAVVDAHLLPHLLVGGDGRVRRLPLGLLGAAWLLAALALASPVWERLPQPVYQAAARHVIVLDLSPTMNATDVAPTRLARARFKVLDLLQREADGQTALLAYGAEPFVVAPLTADAKTIAAQVPSLETALLPEQGPRREDLALAQAGELLRQAGSTEGKVFLITDGLDHPAAAQEAARKLRADGFTVSVLGVGTAKGGPVPLPDGGFVKDRAGAIVMPGLERDALEALATAGGGRYVTATADNRDLEGLIPGHSLELARGERQDARIDRWQEEGPWLLLIILPIAALAFRRGWLSPLLLVLLLAPFRPAHALDWGDLWLRRDQQAARALAAGRADEAAARFQRPDWRAAAHYEAGDYRGALAALDAADDREVDYNKGNAMARLGELEEAIASYDKALQRNPADEDARFNRELVKQALERRQAAQHSAPGQSGQGQSQSQSQSRQGQTGQSAERHGAPPQPGESARDDQGGSQQPDQRTAGRVNPGQQNEGASDKNTEARRDAPRVPSGPEATPTDPEDNATRKPQQGEEGKQLQARQRPNPSAQPAGRDVARRETAETSAHGQDESQSARGDRRDDGAAAGNRPPQPGAAPGLADLVGDDQALRESASPASSTDREARQATEQMLRRVPDDPAGLLRQRFLLQHLRRAGQLPMPETPG